MDDRYRQQLALLREVDEFLRAAKIRYWLRGGWALDFVIGDVTRVHGDIDLVTWKRHEARIRRLFKERGFSATSRDVSVDFERDRVEVNVLFIEKGPNVVYTAGFRDDPRWSEDVLADPPRQFAGLRSRTISPKGLLEEKEKTPAWLGRPLRQKDIEAMEILRSVLASDG